MTNRQSCRVELPATSSLTLTTSIVLALATVGLNPAEGQQQRGTATRNPLEAKTRIDQLKGDSRINLLPPVEAGVRSLVGKLIEADLERGTVDILVNDKEPTRVGVDEKTRVTLDGEAALLADLREGDVVRAVTPDPRSRYAVQLFAVRAERTAPPIRSRVGVVRPEPLRRSIPRDAGAMGIAIFDSPQQGVLIAGVDRGSPADEFGLSVGDYIVAFDGKSVETPDQLISLIRERKANSKADVTLWRERKTERVPVVLTSAQLAEDVVLKKGSLKIAIIATEVVRPWLGLTTQAVQGDGLEVVAVDKSSPADSAGIVPGDLLLRVDDQAVSGPEDIALILDRHTAKTRIAIEVLRGDAVQEVVVRLGEARPVAREEGVETRVEVRETPRDVRDSLDAVRKAARDRNLTASERRAVLEALDAVELQLIP